MIVSVVELKNRLSYYLRRAAKGEEIIVSQHGHEIVKLSQSPGKNALSVSYPTEKGNPFHLPAKTALSAREAKELQAEFLEERKRQRRRYDDLLR